MTGHTRIRRKVTETGTHTYLYPSYSCSNGVKSGGCRQIPIPRDNLEQAIVRILDQDAFAPERPRDLEEALRRVLRRERVGEDVANLRRLQARERMLGDAVAKGARRLLEVPDDVLPEARDALAGMKAELEGVRAAVAAEEARAAAKVDVEERVSAALDRIRSLDAALKGSQATLEQKREALRRLLRPREGKYPIVIYFDFAARQGWRNRLKRATVAHLSLRRATVAPKLVAGVGFEPTTSGL